MVFFVSILYSIFLRRDWIRLCLNFVTKEKLKIYLSPCHIKRLKQKIEYSFLQIPNLPKTHILQIPDFGLVSWRQSMWVIHTGNVLLRILSAVASCELQCSISWFFSKCRFIYIKLIRVANFYQMSTKSRKCICVSVYRAATIITRENNCHFLRVDKDDFNSIIRVSISLFYFRYPYM